MKAHKQKVHEGKVEYHHCDQCEKQFDSMYKLKIHIDRVHEGVRYNCNQCEKSYGAKRELKLHVESVHEGVNVYRFYCDKCEFKCVKKYELKRHVQAKHEGVIFSDASSSGTQQNPNFGKFSKLVQR